MSKVNRIYDYYLKKVIYVYYAGRVFFFHPSLIFS